MATTEQRDYWGLDPTGITQMFINYDDVTGRISSIRVDNQSERTFRVNIYAAADYSTVEFTADVEPKRARTQNIPPGQHYFFEDWIASGGMI